MWISPLTDFSAFELDELYHFIGARKGYENGINSYLMTMASRNPRQIAAFDVDKSVNSEVIQRMSDSVPYAEKYYTDGCPVYLNVVFGGKHIRNTEDKSDTHNIESTNSDFRHYIAHLARRSRTFFRKKETKLAVLAVFINAYNKFGDMKLRTRIPVKPQTTGTRKHYHKWRYPAFSILDFLFVGHQ